MEIRIQDIDGMDEFFRRIGELSVRKVLNKSIKKSIFTLERKAKMETPVDQGILRNSYESRFTDLEGRLRNFREYGIYVHEGHEQTVGRFVPAIGKRLKRAFIPWNPFFQRAIDDTEPKIDAIFTKDIEDFLEDLTQ